MSLTLQKNIQAVVSQKELKQIVELLTKHYGFEPVTSDDWKDVEIYIHQSGKMSIGEAPVIEGETPEYEALHDGDDVLATLLFQLGLIKFFNLRVGSDTQPYEIIEMVNENKALVKRMNHLMVANDYEPKDGEYIRSQSGMDGQVTWLITPNKDPDASVLTVTKRKDGYWYQQGMKSGKYECHYVPATFPIYYYDYQF